MSQPLTHEPILDLGEASKTLGLSRQKIRQLVWADLLTEAGGQGRFLFWQSDVDRAKLRLHSLEAELDAKREALGHV